MMYLKYSAKPQCFCMTKNPMEFTVLQIINL